MLSINSITVVTSILSFLVVIGSAVFVLLKDWKSQVNRFYVYYCVTGMGIVFGMVFTYSFPDSIHLLQVNRFLQVSTVLFFSSFLTLSFVFPKPEKRIPFWFTSLIILPAVLAASIAFFTDYTISKAYFKDGVFIREFRFFYNYYLLIGVLYFVTGTFNFIRNYIKTDVYIYRLQMRYIFIGGFIGIVTTTTLSLILPRFFNYSKLYGLSPSFTTIIITAALFYSIVAYNLMDIRTVIHKTMMYFIISTLIFLPIAGIVFLIYSESSLFKKVPVEAAASGIVLLFVMFSVYIQPLIDRYFKRKQYEFESVVDDFIRNAGDVKQTSVIVERAIDLLYKSLYLEKAFMLMLTDRYREYDLYYSRGMGDVDFEAVKRSSMIIRWFVRNTELLTRGRVYSDEKNFGEIRDEFIAFFRDYGVRVIIPVYHERRLLGLICLGEKESLSAFTPAEVEKLTYFKAEVNELISTALTYEKGMKEQFVSRTIDLSRYILSKSVPVSLPNVEGIKFGAFFIPKYEGGIDYFDFIRPGKHGIGVIGTDVSGVGMNSALYSVVLRSAFQGSINDAPSTYSVMKTLNRVLYEYSGGRGELITAYYLYYDIKNMRLMYTNAGFPALDVFRVESRDFDVLDTEGIPLGYDLSASYGIGRTNMLKGDIGILYSKSLVSSKNQQGEEFGLMRIRRIIRENRNQHPSEIADLVNKTFQNFMGLASPASDVLLLVFKIV